MDSSHGITSRAPVLARAAVLALALVVGLGAAVPATAAPPRADAERPSWAAPWTYLGDLLASLFGGGERPARLIGQSEADDGPDMDPNGFGDEGDGGPDMDPDGLGDEGDDGPHMDPNG